MGEGTTGGALSTVSSSMGIGATGLAGIAPLSSCLLLRYYCQPEMGPSGLTHYLVGWMSSLCSIRSPPARGLLAFLLGQYS